MKITEALSNVYTAMGGTDTFNKDDIAEGIDQISEVAGGGGSGGSSFVVNISTAPKEGSEGWFVMTFDHTFSEIVQSIENGIVPPVIASQVMPSSWNKDVYSIVGYAVTDNKDVDFYTISILFDGKVENFTAGSADGYPYTEFQSE